MDWIQRLNSAIRYIEVHLSDEIDYGQLGRIACCSSYHFQRMFSYMAGVTLSEYIRRRKMSLAAVDLQNGARIVDVALQYGYQSPTAFNRAFQSVHGIPPSAVRQKGASVKSFPPLSFKITIKGVEELNYRVEKREAFRVVGVSLPIDRNIEKNFETIPAFWDEAHRNGTISELISRMDRAPMGVLGVCTCNEQEQWRYYIAVSTDGPAGSLEEFTVPAMTWAIFPGSGTGVSIQALEQRIFSEWLPTSGYEYADAPDIEVYLNADPDQMQYEVWIPVRKKQ